MSAAGRILVTGASGFVGHRVVARLRNAGADVVATARHATIGIDRVVDLFDQRAVDEMLDDVRPATIVHLAWCANPGRFWSDPSNAVWTSATLLLAERAAVFGMRSFVAAGSCAEPPSALAPTLYGTAKGATRDVLARWSDEVGVRFAWGRVFYVYGEDEAPGKLFTTAARTLAAGKTFSLRTPDDELDFVHADDAADAFITLVDDRAAGIYDIGTGAATRVEDAATMLARLLGRGEVRREDSAQSPRRVIADTAPLSGLGWQSRITVAGGLERIASAFGA